MTASPATSLPPSLNSLVAGFLRVLANERGASAHTLRAYERELHGFAAWATERFGAESGVAQIEHTHIRAFLGTLYDRGLSKASAPVPSPPSAAGSSGSPVRVTLTRMPHRWLPRLACPNIYLASPPSSR